MSDNPSDSPDEMLDLNIGETLVSSQIVITSGFDEDGEAQVWVQNNTDSLVQALGLIEAAKAYIVMTAYA